MSMDPDDFLIYRRGGACLVQEPTVALIQGAVDAFAVNDSPDLWEAQIQDTLQLVKDVVFSALPPSNNEETKTSPAASRLVNQLLRWKGVALNTRQRRGYTAKSEGDGVGLLLEVIGAELKWRCRCALKEVEEAPNAKFQRFNPERGFLPSQCADDSSVEETEGWASSVEEAEQGDAGVVDTRTYPPGVRKRFCRQCAFPCPTPTRSFCSTGCLHLYKMRSSGSYVRALLLVRDAGICALCDLDCEHLRRRLNTEITRRTNALALENGASKGIPKRVQRGDLLDLLTATFEWGGRFRLNRRGTAVSRGSIWHADHVLAVCKGGGNCCDLNNYRTLCVPCHHKVTAELRKDIAIQNRRATPDTLHSLQQPAATSPILDAAVAGESATTTTTVMGIPIEVRTSSISERLAARRGAKATTPPPPALTSSCSSEESHPPAARTSATSRKEAKTRRKKRVGRWYTRTF